MKNPINIFPTKIYHAASGIDCEHLYNSVRGIITELYPVAERHKQYHMVGDVNTCYNFETQMHRHDELKSLVEYFETQAHQYWKDLGYSAKQKPKLVEMWYNLYKKGGYVEMHCHGRTTISASFYLQQPVNGGNLAFEHPFHALMKYQPYDEHLGKYQKDYWEYSVPVKTGDLILFPGYLNHRSYPNQSDQDRIIIGGNFLPVPL
jgi:uncharacterized protein (TIGR02466 family)